MVGLSPVEVSDVEQDGKVRVGFTAQALDPPTDDDSWGIDAASKRVSLRGDTVTVTATIKPDDAIGPAQKEAVVSTASPWTGTITANVVGDITERDTLTLELAVQGSSETASGEYDLSKLDDSFDTPDVENGAELPNFTAGEVLDEDDVGSVTRRREGSALPDTVWEQGGGLTPKLQSYEEVETGDEERERRIVDEFEPLVVTRLGGTLPWNTESTQLQCGTTITDATDDLNVRLVYHAICTKSQFDTLISMRSRPNNIRLISHAYNGDSTFDELRFDRVVDANGAVSATDGRITEPIYEIQLQSKEDEGN